MYIDDSKTIAGVQKEFTTIFKGLKIEFYKTNHKTHEGSFPKDAYHHDAVLKDIRNVHTNGELTIDSKMSTGELETAFESKFGLHVQVFRKSGNLWLQTSTTDDWSLEKQNKKALQS